MSSYKKEVITFLPGLKYLDDRPVFVEDRRYAEAYCKGGIEAERAERTQVKKEKDEEHERNHQAFKDMIKRAREQKQKDDEEKKQKELRE